MANKILLDVASSGSNVNGTETGMDGGKNAIHIIADSYGTDGKVVLKGSPDGNTSNLVTLSDPNTLTGLAEYSANIVVVLDKLGQGWTLRADLVISAGTATNLKVTLATN